MIIRVHPNLRPKTLACSTRGKAHHETKWEEPSSLSIPIYIILFSHSLSISLQSQQINQDSPRLSSSWTMETTMTTSARKPMIHPIANLSNLNSPFHP
jgi:hypothetical protein